MKYFPTNTKSARSQHRWELPKRQRRIKMPVRQSARVIRQMKYLKLSLKEYRWRHSEVSVVVVFQAYCAADTGLPVCTNLRTSSCPSLRKFKLFSGSERGEFKTN